MSSSREYKYKFSFVMPVYNVEQYLSETIESVLAQDIGFKENIQLILVNDGSSDGSSKVAKHYQNKYPQNITYVEQENKGVSAARNAGVERVEGKYISFLDSDDLLSPDTISEVYDFFEEHYEEIDLVSIKLEFFEAKTGPHPLNYKYKTTKVVDIESDFDHIQLSGGSVFVKTEAIKNKYKFDTRLQTAEDATFITEVILDKLAYGVLAEPTYFYRKRLSQDSAIGSSLTNKSWYVATPKYAYKHMFEIAKKKLGYVPKYVQFLVMYDLQWRFTQQSLQGVPVGVDIDSYKQSLYTLLQYIDDDIILSQTNIYSEYKIFILQKKYGQEGFKNALKRVDTKYYLGDVLIHDNEWRHRVFIDTFEVKNCNVKIYGRVGGIILTDLQFGFSVGGKFYKAEHHTRQDSLKYFLDEIVYDKNSFVIEFSITQNNEHVKPELRMSGWRKQIPIEGTRHSRLAPYLRGSSYTVFKNYLVCHVQPSLLVFVERSSYRVLVKESKYLVALSLKYIRGTAIRVRRVIRTHVLGRESNDTVIHGVAASIIMLRLAYWLTKPFLSKRVWLISDRREAAGDNGEAFFDFVTKQYNPGITPYFVLPKKSKDYPRIKRIGKIVSPYSIIYKVLFLHSNKIISSSADHHTMDIFNDKQPYLRNLIDFDFVFLQHGIIHNDLSEWLNKYKKNIKLFIVSTEREREAIASSTYGYTNGEVQLTGLGRFDLLDNDPKNKLIIMPSWRKYVVNEINPSTGERDHNPTFNNTEYFKFYQKLLSDKRLIEALRSSSFTAEFYLHPSLNKQAKDFQGTDLIKIMQFPHNYRKAFQEGNVLLTDYSSVAFDFAYLRKPVLYAQFDKQKFYASHTLSEGYFSYEKDGFGTVVYDYEATIDQVVKLINKSSSVDTLYRQRVDNFFKYNDKNNRRRIYQTILNLDIDEHIYEVTNKLYKDDKVTKKSPLPVFWWRYNYPIEQNFGDEITPYIIKSIWGVRTEWSTIDEASMVGAGSILEMLELRRTKEGLKVWGSGYMRDGELNDNKNLDFHAVRGPVSLSRIEQSKRKIALGDPGLLANIVFSRSRLQTYKVGIIPHYVDVKSEYLDAIRENSDYLIIDVLQTPEKVALDITSCEYILSSSLHGVIFADSFGIPNNWLPLSDKVSGGEYKFTDYYKSTGRELVKLDPSIIGNEMQINKAKQSYVPIENLKQIQEDLITSFPFKEGIE